MYVVGPTLHFQSDGTPIPTDEQEYVWIPSILKKMKVRHSPISELPDLSPCNPLKAVLKGMRQLLGDNACSGIFILGEDAVFVCR